METTSFTPPYIQDILTSLSSAEPHIENALSRALNAHRGIKWYIALTARYTKRRNDGDWITREQVFSSTSTALTDEGDKTNQIATAFQEVFTHAQSFEAEGSGWSLEEVVKVEVKTVAYRPLQGSSYIELPTFIQSKRAVVNIHNHDNQCLKWSLLAYRHPVNKHAERLSQYIRYKDELNMTGVTFPTPLDQIALVERNNNLSINVFGYDEEDKVYPIRVARQTQQDNHVNLLYVTNENTSHYCWIRHFSRLMGHRTGHHGKCYYCYNCLHGFSKEHLLTDHQELCFKQRTQKVKFPIDTIAKFKNIQRQLRAPFIIYADFECYTTRIHTCMNNPKQSNSTAYQYHQPSGFAYVVVSTADKHTKPAVVYRGKDVVKTFLDRLLEESRAICTVLRHPLPMVISNEQNVAFQAEENCHICNQTLGVDRVRDHDHMTGAYRGAAHNKCNLAYHFSHRPGVRKSPATEHSDQPCPVTKSMEYVLPVVFHNLRGYDCHLLMSDIGAYKSEKLKCIPNNTERYLSVSLGCLRFIDSYQFMAAPLEKLVANLDSDKFHQTRKNVDCSTRQNLLLRKGVYPYDYVNCANRLEETSLPAKDQFFSELTQETISDEDYKHAQTVWQEFRCKTLGDYHDVYLKADVLLLADVFEQFRTMSLETYKLDPAHYFTSPGLAWDAMLRHTGIELELLTDPDMYLMIEAGIRGGVSMITKKHSKANNPYIKESYDIDKPVVYLMYLDANNLYGWAMCRAMPEKDFVWCTEQQLHDLNVMDIDERSTIGYFLEVDLDIPVELHDLHNDYPLAPEQRVTPLNELSPYTQELYKKLKLSGKPQPKLVPTLHPKRNYVVHYFALQNYIQHGAKLVKIHRGLQFKQCQWLKPYIELNTEKRKHAANAFEKDFFKLMNNSVFGKTMENVRGRINLELVHTDRRMRRLSCKPNFHRLLAFNQNLVAVQCLKSTLCLDKPIYVGCAILDTSKTLMYDFHYNYVKQRYGSKARLCFTDTDSLLYEFTDVDDIYRDMKEDQHLFDTSDYPKEHMLYSARNKKILGKMKDEMAGVPIVEFVGLRSKQYSIDSGKEQKKTAKGIKKSAIRQLRHEMYRQSLLDETTSMAGMNNIRSHMHRLYSEHLNKEALSPYDDKRYVLDDKVSTRAHGHRLNHTQTDATLSTSE